MAAIVVPKDGKEVILSELREWAKEHMASYAIPTMLRCVDRLPKNAMGKVNKKELVATMFPPEKPWHVNTVVQPAGGALAAPSSS